MEINSYDDFLRAVREINKANEFSGYEHDNEYQQALTDLLRKNREAYVKYQRTMEKNFRKSLKADRDIVN